MPVHIKTIPNDFLMILQQSNGGHLAKSLCLCEIMQKRIPTDTRKSHFPTWGRRETGFVSKEKNLCQIPSATLLQAHKRIKFSHFASMFLRLSCFFPAQLLTLQKRGLKVHSGTIGQIPSKSPPPSSTSAQTTSRTLEYDNRIEFPKK